MEQTNFPDGVVHLVTISPVNHIPIVRTFRNVSFSEMLFIRHKCEKADVNGSCIVLIDYYDAFNETVVSKGYPNLNDVFLSQITRRLVNL